MTNFLYKSIIDFYDVDSIDIPNIIRLNECSYSASATEKQHKTIINLKLIYFTGFIVHDSIGVFAHLLLMNVDELISISL